MPSKCPLCGQSLPHGFSSSELKSRLHKLSSPALAAEKSKLKAEYDSRRKADVANEVARQSATLERQFQAQLRAAERQAKVDAERRMTKQVQAAEKRAQVAEDRKDAEIQRARREAEIQAKRLANAENEAKIQKLQAGRERERLREAERAANLQGKVEDLQRRLENQSGERLGAEAERNLFAELRAAFPLDRFERIGRGVKGADILHMVVDGSKVVGKIVYESKNTLTWLKDFIVQAKKYRAQYDTPHVIIVSRVFPAKQKGFCVANDIPVVAPSMSVALATIVREGIIEIGELRISGNSRDGKSLELYEYIVGDKFCARFRELAEAVDSLRVQQQNERRWHDRVWQEESRIHDSIARSHSEVDSHIKSICRGVTTIDVSKMPSRSALSQGAMFKSTSSR